MARGRPKKIKDPVNLSINVSQEYKKHIQKQAALAGSKEGRVIGVAEFIRRVLDAGCPLPNSAMKFGF